MRISIVTPTYNRASLLRRLYLSLKKQKDKDFTWIIVDDGSTDNTRENVNLFFLDNPGFDIIYEFKENSGKSSSLNFVFYKYLEKFDFFLVIDSDDQLYDLGTYFVKKSVVKYDAVEIGAIFYQYDFIKNNNINITTNVSYSTPLKLTRYEYDRKVGKHDGAIGYYARTVRKYEYPCFPNENYVGPTTIQMEMSEEFKIVFMPDVIGKAEYQKDGLSKSGRKLRINNPLGMIYYCSLMQSEQTTFFNNVIYSVMAQAYRFFVPKDNRVYLRTYEKYFKLWAFIPGFFLFLLWSVIYED